MARRVNYDKDHINENLVLVVESYLGAPERKEGARRVYNCPRCGSDNLHLNPDYRGRQIVGCFGAGCGVPRVMDALDFVALMESLDVRRQFAAVCEKAAQIVPGCVVDEAPESKPSGNPAEKHAGDGSPGSDEPGGAAAREGETPAPHDDPAANTDSGGQGAQSSTDGGQSAEEPGDLYRLRHRVFERLLANCPLNREAYGFLYERGLTDDTILDGRFGFFRASKGRLVFEDLWGAFGESLLSVPGFSRDGERVVFTLLGHDRLLIPYFDRHGCITNLEGRILPKDQKRVDQKYLSLRNSGSHLYLFPTLDFDRIEAFCEGVFGAIVAAQEGVAVGSIQGFRRYRRSGSDEVLEELEGVDFAGRRIPYIPDTDEPPKEEVMAEAPEAARWLVERQNGEPAIALLPEGKDLDEYLLSLPASKRPQAVRALVDRSMSLPTFEQQLRAVRRSRASATGGDGGEGGRSRPSGAVHAPGGGNSPQEEPEPPAPHGHRGVSESPAPHTRRTAARLVQSYSETTNGSGGSREGARGATGYTGSRHEARETAAETGQPPVEQLVEQSVRRAEAALKVLFVLIVALVLYRHAAGALSHVFTVRGIVGWLLLASAAFALAAAPALAVLAFGWWRARRRRRFRDGQWIPGER